MFFIRRAFSLLISFFLFLPVSPVQTYSFTDSENIKMSAVILSDVHMEGNNSDRFERFGKTLSGVYSGDFNPDAVCFCGDNTMNGQWIEWLDFYGFVNRYCKKSSVIMSFGNHDFGNTADGKTYDRLSKRCVSCYNGYLKKNIDNVCYTETVNGYKFIVLSAGGNTEDTVQVITDEQVEWLESELKDCADRNIPAFILNHNLLYGKNGNRSYWNFNQTTNSDKIVAALEQSGTDVIYFCGHSHYGVNSGSVNKEGRVTYVNLPSAGNTGNYGASDANADYGTGCLLEVYDGYALLRFRNFAKGYFLDGFDNFRIPFGEN